MSKVKIGDVCKDKSAKIRLVLLDFKAQAVKQLFLFCAELVELGF